ncbi:cob(I)yrinic acid a,c-diamide adenosyltransferase [Crassaminicella thermophila]|uniref:Cob(I)yrinic acid a,c-diamide adenosyltransferase n=1 Tax=Crassaminicella thermophila TaxID=2599308 RepID=A0A5C0SC14_CRATE|nr:cob(I)yrinic acid a,c-diamide adenosyltransferase [Crassaminicella thermophila]QEK11048.1 cob(I)yrinic acid a,c-diamide adenosyltransferase [Crassaminicella thermophila]
MDKGYIHVYTGNGKGKTTAALGLALRAAGAGKKIFIAQFVKSMEYSEIKALKSLKDSIDIKLYGHGCFITKNPDKKDILAAQEALKKVRNILVSNKYDIVILDEITIAIFYNLLSTQDVLSLLEDKPDHVELIITGRYCPQEIIDKAHLVTEMKEIKHYYTQGVLSREGIDK